MAWIYHVQKHYGHTKRYAYPDKLEAVSLAEIQDEGMFLGINGGIDVEPSAHYQEQVCEQKSEIYFPGPFRA